MIRWWRWRREVRRLEREAEAAYLRWMRARHEHSDTVVVFRETPGAWGDGPIGRTMDRVSELSEEFRRIDAQARRARECGP